MPSYLISALTVACALFMENLDSTVIATSLPAIARDLHRKPDFPKTRPYLLPCFARDFYSRERLGGGSVWRPQDLPDCHCRIHHGFDFLRHGFRFAGTCWRPHPSRPWRRDDGSGRTAFAAALRRTRRTRERSVLSDGAGAARADHGAAPWRLYHDIFPLAVDFLDQCADRRSSASFSRPFSSRMRAANPHGRSTCRASSFAGSGLALLLFGLGGAGRGLLPW